MIRIWPDFYEDDMSPWVLSSIHILSVWTQSAESHEIKCLLHPRPMPKRHTIQYYDHIVVLELKWSSMHSTYVPYYNFYFYPLKNAHNFSFR
jgi:hypothetical protein